MWPNLVIAGAPKCGSTTLYNLLKQHPDICMSQVKEPRIYLDNWHQQAQKEHFTHYNGEKIIGEASVCYAHSSLAVSRMAQVAPHTKLVFILKNPVHRTYSHYWARVRRRREFRSWQKAIYQQDLREYLYCNSLYFTNISRFLRHFSKGQVHIIIFEEFKKSPQTHLDGLTEFLGVESMQFSHLAHHNKGSKYTSVMLPSWSQKIRAKIKLPNKVRPIAGATLRQFERLLTSPVNVKAIKPYEYQFLWAIFEEEIKGIEGLLGQKTPWSASNKFERNMQNTLNNVGN